MHCSKVDNTDNLINSIHHNLGRESYDSLKKFNVLPGADEINGSTWAGLSKEDFVVGALAGKAANGGKNGWDISGQSLFISFW
jgi:hypothetical protein